MKIPIISKYIGDKVEKEARQKVSKLLGTYFPTDLIDKKSWWDEESFAPENKEEYAQAYERHIWTYACISKIAENASSVPLKLYLKGKEEEITTGSFWNLINMPNPESSQQEFFEAFFSYLMLTGDSFIELNDSSRPTMMKVLRSYWMDIHYNSALKQYEYRYKPQGVPLINFTKDEILHFKLFHPNSDLYGMSPIQTVTDDIIIDKNSTAYTKKFFSKGGMINLYLSVKATLQDFEFQRAKKEVRESLTGLKNAHNIPVFDGESELKSVNTNIDSVLLKETKDSCRDEILAAFGVPPIMFGFLSGMETFNNSEIQTKTFWESTVIPKLNKTESFLNRNLFWKFNLEVKYDKSTIKALKEDEQKQSTTVSTLKNAGIITVNEARTEMGYDPIPGGDVLQAQQVSPITMSIQEPVKKNSLGKAITLNLIKAAKDTHLQDFDYAELKFQKALIPFFKQLEKKIIADVTGINKADSDLLSKVLGTMDDETKRLMKELAEVSDDVAQRVMKSNYNMNIGYTPKEMYKNTLDRTRRHIVKWSENSANQISDTIKGKLELVLKNPMDVGELTKSVKTIFQGEDMTYGHAKNIARTESNRVANDVRKEVSKSLGFTRKSWLTTIDGKERDAHADVNGTTIGIDEKFMVGGQEMDVPGDPNGGPGNVCNCRCTALYS